MRSHDASPPARTHVTAPLVRRGQCRTAQRVYRGRTHVDGSSRIPGAHRDATGARALDDDIEDRPAPRLLPELRDYRAALRFGAGRLWHAQLEQRVAKPVARRRPARGLE